MDLLSHPRLFESFVVDHLIPRSRGGGNAADNLRVACAACDYVHVALANAIGISSIILILIADEIQLAGLDLVVHAPVLERLLTAVGEPPVH